MHCLQDPNEPCYCHHATMQRARKHQLINDEIKIIYYHLKLPMTIWNCAKVTQLTLLIKSLVLFLVWLDSTNKFILIHKNFSDRMHFPTIKVAINQLLYYINQLNKSSDGEGFNINAAGDDESADGLTMNLEWRTISTK